MISIAVLAQAVPVREVIGRADRGLEALGSVGPLVYGAFYVVAALLLVPGSIPTIGAGALFGLRTGLLTAWAASTVAAALAFLVSRYVARAKVAEVARRKPELAAFERAFGEGGWRVVALLRLSTIVPFNLQSYFYGLTRIRFWPCLLTTAWAIVPGTMLFVYIGHVAGAGLARDRSRAIWEWGLMALGLVTVVAATVYLSSLARKRLERHPGGGEVANGAGTRRGRRDEPGEPSPSWKVEAGPRPWTVCLCVALALIAVAAALYAHLCPECIERLLVEPLGP